MSDFRAFLAFTIGLLPPEGSLHGPRGVGDPCGTAAGESQPEAMEELVQAASCLYSSLLEESAGLDSKGRWKRATGVPRQAVLGAAK